MTKKYLLDFKIIENRSFNNGYSLLVLTPADGSNMPHIEGGQFVNIQIDKSKNTYLRRPISVNNVDYAKNQLWLLIKDAGEGTHTLCESQPNDLLNILLPLGTGFTKPENKNAKILLIGGGVGIAPMLYWGNILKNFNYQPIFLLGGRKSSDLLELDEFEKIGKVFISTEDGSLGETGFVTTNSILNEQFDMIYCCGPQPMMKAVAKLASDKNCQCEVSLENKMACGLGACLCCVEDTTDGNTCVCTSGPVFNTKFLKW